MTTGTDDRKIGSSILSAEARKQVTEALNEYAEVMADARPDEGHEESPEWDDEDDGWFNDPDMGDRS